MDGLFCSLTPCWTIFLRAPGVRFAWRSNADLADAEALNRAGVAAYAAENPAMVD